jgi:hypothetical protein
MVIKLRVQRYCYAYTKKLDVNELRPFLYYFTIEAKRDPQEQLLPRECPTYVQVGIRLLGVSAGRTISRPEATGHKIKPNNRSTLLLAAVATPANSDPRGWMMMILLRRSPAS